MFDGRVFAVGNDWDNISLRASKEVANDLRTGAEATRLLQKESQ
jgi:hypothetical protein